MLKTIQKQFKINHSNISFKIFKKYNLQYPDGKTWPLIINENETAKEGDTNYRGNVDSWKEDQQQIFDLIAENQDLSNSSIGGTYNPRSSMADY